MSRPQRGNQRATGDRRAARFKGAVTGASLPARTSRARWRMPNRRAISHPAGLGASACRPSRALRRRSANSASSARLIAAWRVGAVILRAEQIGDVEHVDHALAEGRDMRRGDVEVELRQRRGQLVEQARPVEPGHLDHGVAVRPLVVDGHLGLDREGLERGPCGGARLATTSGSLISPRSAFSIASAMRAARRASSSSRSNSRETAMVSSASPSVVV